MYYIYKVMYRKKEEGIFYAHRVIREGDASGPQGPKLEPA